MRVFSVKTVKLAILKSNPPMLSIVAHGQVTSTGWRNPNLVPLEKKLSPDGILDVEFVADPPKGISLPVLTDIVGDLIWEGDVDRVVGVRVVAKTIDITELMSPAGDVTTLALGEESFGSFTTLALGEEDSGGLTGPILEKWTIGETNPFADVQKPFMREKEPFGEDFNRIEALVRPRSPFGRR